LQVEFLLAGRDPGVSDVHWGDLVVSMGIVSAGRLKTSHRR